jgi:hypothetical protein
VEGGQEQAMTVFQYKVDSSQVAGISAFEAKLNAAGADRWELIVADDSGLLIYKRDASSPKLKYKIVQPPPTLLQPIDLQNFLQPYGSQGWEMIVLSMDANEIIFKQEI